MIVLDLLIIREILFISLCVNVRHEMILLEKKYKKRNMDNVYEQYTEMMYEAIDNINKFIK